MKNVLNLLVLLFAAYLIFNSIRFNPKRFNSNYEESAEDVEHEGIIESFIIL